jgi:hypothetical protein
VAVDLALQGGTVRREVGQMSPDEAEEAIGRVDVGDGVCSAGGAEAALDRLGVGPEALGGATGELGGGTAARAHLGVEQ